MSRVPGAPRIAVVGAGSLIGEALLAELREKKFPRAELHLLDDARELGRNVDTEDERLPVADVAAFDFARVDLAFFCGRAAISERYAEAAAATAWVIDSSSAFRGRLDVPLIVADVNGAELTAIVDHAIHGLVALPGSASAGLATVLGPLHAYAELERVEVATYQAVSGSGRSAMEGLAAETVDLLGGRTTKRHNFGRQIAFNVIPQVDVFGDDGISLEERRLSAETCRVIGAAHVAINATAVRVPVFFGHCFAVHASFKGSASVDGAAEILRRSKGIELIDAGSARQFPTPATEALSPDRVYVGRLRADSTRDAALNFWIVADNVRKCAALNAFSVAQILVNRTPVSYS
jgi:aspartate-semialdehyde dehydrogenase